MAVFYLSSPSIMFSDIVITRLLFEESPDSDNDLICENLSLWEHAHVNDIKLWPVCHRGHSESISEKTRVLKTLNLTRDIIFSLFGLGTVECSQGSNPEVRSTSQCRGSHLDLRKGCQAIIRTLDHSGQLVGERHVLITLKTSFVDFEKQ